MDPLSGDYKKETDEWEFRNANKKTLSGNRPIWPRMLRASTDSVPELHMNRSLERPTTSCGRK